VRITISHNRTKEEIMQSVDRSFSDALQGAGSLPVKIVVEQKNWQGSTLSFSLAAKMGLMSTPIRGTIEVTDHDVTIDADLGVLERFIPEKTARELIGERIRGLLN
jgi:hypothetical protein